MKDWTTPNYTGAKRERKHRELWNEFNDLSAATAAATDAADKAAKLKQMDRLARKLNYMVPALDAEQAARWATAQQELDARWLARRR